MLPPIESLPLTVINFNNVKPFDIIDRIQNTNFIKFNSNFNDKFENHIMIQMKWELGINRQLQNSLSTLIQPPISLNKFFSLYVRGNEVIPFDKEMMDGEITQYNRITFHIGKMVNGKFESENEVLKNDSIFFFTLPYVLIQ